MTDLDDLARLALARPEVSEGTSYGNRAWKVGRKTFAWERPLRPADLDSFAGTEAPAGPIVGLRVDDLAEKEAILQAGHRGVFTVAHFDGSAAVLVDLDAVEADVLAELVADAWLCSAPRRLARAHLEGRDAAG